MNVGRTVFAQLIAHLSHIDFQKCVTRYDGDQHHRSVSCWDQYLAMAFAQFTYRESLRTPDLAQGFWAGEENDLTRICRSGWLLRAALKEKLGPCRSFSCRSFRRA